MRIRFAFLPIFNYDYAMADIPTLCPKCHNQFFPGTNFCPNCGYHVAEEVKPISIGRQIYQYVCSVIMPPFGLVWAFKYFRSGNSQHKKVGWVIVALTCISLVVTTWYMVGLFQNVSNQLNSYSNISY